MLIQRDDDDDDVDSVVYVCCSLQRSSDDDDDDDVFALLATERPTYRLNSHVYARKPLPATQCSPPKRFAATERQFTCPSD